MAAFATPSSHVALPPSLVDFCASAAFVTLYHNVGGSSSNDDCVTGPFHDAVSVRCAAHPGISSCADWAGAAGGQIVRRHVLQVCEHDASRNSLVAAMHESVFPSAMSEPSHETAVPCALVVRTASVPDSPHCFAVAVQPPGQPR